MIQVELTLIGPAKKINLNTKRSLLVDKIVVSRRWQDGMHHSANNFSVAAVPQASTHSHK